jgi:hypothetical protein
VYEEVSELMQWRVDLLMAERCEDLAREHLFPFVMYQDERQLVLTSPEEFVDVCSKFCVAQRSRNVAQIRVRVFAVDLPRHSRFRVWVGYDDLDLRGDTLHHWEAIHYCRETQCGLKSEMLELGAGNFVEIWERHRLAVGQ